MKHALHRALLAVPLMLSLSLLAFGLLRVAPGGPFDPARAPLSPEIEEVLQDRYRLTDPLWKQYLRYVGLLWEWDLHDGWLHAQTGLFQGDPGPSLTYLAHEVRARIADSLQVSLTLGLLAFILAVGVGIPLGVLTALPPRDWLAAPGCPAALLIGWVPVFVVGPILAMTFASMTEWVPTRLGPGPLHVGLPATILGLFLGGRIARLIREGTRTALESPFVLAARARGLTEGAVLRRQVFRHALLPIVSCSGPLLASLLTGGLVVENVFRVPGLGSALVQSTINRDFLMLVNVALLGALMLLLLNWGAQLLHRLLDPRLRRA